MRITFLLNASIFYFTDYSNKSTKTINNWMTPSALTHNLSSQPFNNLSWPNVASATLHSLKNGQSNLMQNTDENSNRMQYGVRPTQNIHLNGGGDDHPHKPYFFKSLNYPTSDTEFKVIQMLRRPKAAASLRDSGILRPPSLHNGSS